MEGSLLRVLLLSVCLLHAGCVAQGEDEPYEPNSLSDCTAARIYASGDPIYEGWSGTIRLSLYPPTGPAPINPGRAYGFVSSFLVACGTAVPCGKEKPETLVAAAVTVAPAPAFFGLAYEHPTELISVTPLAGHHLADAGEFTVQVYCWGAIGGESPPVTGAIQVLPAEAAPSHKPLPQ